MNINNEREPLLNKVEMLHLFRLGSNKTLLGMKYLLVSTLNISWFEHFNLSINSRNASFGHSAVKLNWCTYVQQVQVSSHFLAWSKLESPHNPLTRATIFSFLHLTCRQVRYKLKFAKYFMVLGNTILEPECPIESVADNAGLDVEHIIISISWWWHQGCVDISQFNRELFSLGSWLEDTLFMDANHEVEVCPKRYIDNSEALHATFLSIAQLVRETYLIGMLNGNHRAPMLLSLPLWHHSLQIFGDNVAHPNLKGTRYIPLCRLILDEVGKATFELEQIKHQIWLVIVAVWLGGVRVGGLHGAAPCCAQNTEALTLGANPVLGRNKSWERVRNLRSERDLALKGADFQARQYEMLILLSVVDWWLEYQ